MVVSLDLELHWGLRDLFPVEGYRENLLGVRRAVPAILDVFGEYDVHATWATVGLIMFRERDELLAELPEIRPKYRQANLSPYLELDALGRNEEDDPFHFGASLVEQVRARPHQEIATHTLSHFYCLEAEEGPRLDAFEADIDAALAVGKRRGLVLESIVFPRNQYSRAHLEVCSARGLVAYRGNPPSWLYGPELASLPRRSARLVDAYLNVTGHHTWQASSSRNGVPTNVPASRFLRPYTPGLVALEGQRLRRIAAGLDEAASNGDVFHLWWHPHNFGAHLQENLDFLRKVLDHFASLRERTGMRSLTMGEITHAA